MEKEPRTEELRDQYRHGDFYPSRRVLTVPWDEKARVIRLTRRSKKQFVEGVGLRALAGMTAARVWFATLAVGTRGFTSNWTFAA